MSLIEAEHVQKVFQVAVRRTGRLAAVRTLLARDYRDVRAVDDVSFRVEAGEMVGYIGPNGAGKSTTIKMLTGILVPSGGRIEIDGRVPYVQRREHVRRLGVVFGQRTQLWWDLPVIESFELLQHVYRIPAQRWRANLDMFSQLLDLGPFLETPVRQLSLGQRMRADLAAALLHDPNILFLDEPTIGLDVVARERIRQFLTAINRERGVTVLLTTHDLEDVVRLCPRVVLIDHGRVIFDGAVEHLRTSFGRQRTLVLDLSEAEDTTQPISVPHAEVLRRDGPRVWLGFDRDTITAADLIAQVVARYRIRDLTIVEPDIEAVVRGIYESGSLAPATH